MVVFKAPISKNQIPNNFQIRNSNDLLLTLLLSPGGEGGVRGFRILVIRQSEIIWNLGFEFWNFSPLFDSGYAGLGEGLRHWLSPGYHRMRLLAQVRPPPNAVRITKSPL